jgi:hypothetical protein
MGTIIPPALFGIDPDETWDYTPASAVGLPEAQRPVFRLRSPDAGLDQLMEDEASTLYAAVRKTMGSKIAELRALGDVLEKDRTDEQKAKIEALNAEWSEAFVDAAQKTDRTAIQRRVLGFCVVGWDNLCTPSGKAVLRPKDDAKVIDSLGKVLRADVFAAIKRGIEVTPEEKASLT